MAGAGSVYCSLNGNEIKHLDSISDYQIISSHLNYLLNTSNEHINNILKCTNYLMNTSNEHLNKLLKCTNLRHVQLMKQ